MSAQDTSTQGTSAADGTIPGPRDSADQPVDLQLLEQLVGRVVVDLGGAWAAPLVRLGDRLGLFTAMADGATTTPDALADRTGTAPRYVAEWLLAMAASGYVEPRGDDRFGLSPEQVACFTDADSPAYVVGGFQLQSAGVRAADRLVEAFRTGAGMGWHEHHEDLFEGTERFFRPSYLAHLTTEWIPALAGLEDRLRSGAQVADVGCGLGASTRIMAKAYPASFFIGLDYHEQSITLARERAEAAGLANRIRFDSVPADRLSGHYDLVTLFDCVHDMPDPLGALEAVRRGVRDDGWVLMVEPMSGDRVEDAVNPVSRVYAAASVFLCLPSGLSAEPRAGLGNQVGPARTIALAEQAGFTRCREAARTPFNIVYELRP